MSRLILSLSLLCLACGPKPTTQPKADIVYDVGKDSLLKDHQTASAYIGQKIRVRIESTHSRIVGGELHVWAMDQTVPPAIIIKVSVFPSKDPVTVVGKVTSVIRDGKWRSPRCDFYIVIEDCVVTAR